ncbi:hypothetical protein ABZ820_35040 [Streptomyces diacarni]|uniref:Uncharacterized protein n=1 Tax=Streptomyces diacarni TaxID=2800381 RepID=A0A367EIA9_9ACTN|nr:hypothetical protein [Streptomyces diacarni]RCG17828.1 hypothetical protein DTL70_26550 [Streptomyces diacarni]
MSDMSNESAAQQAARDVEELEQRSQTAARLFDVRRIIGGLFVVYGVIVTLAGVFASDEDLKKAQDININLWTGIGMLILGLAFLLWLRLSPTIPPPDAEKGAPEGTDGNEGTAGTERGEGGDSGK